MNTNNQSYREAFKEKVAKGDKIRANIQELKEARAEEKKKAKEAKKKIQQEAIELLDKEEVKVTKGESTPRPVDPYMDLEKGLATSSYATIKYDDTVHNDPTSKAVWILSTLAKEEMASADSPIEYTKDNMVEVHQHIMDKLAVKFMITHYNTYVSLVSNEAQVEHYNPMNTEHKEALMNTLQCALDCDDQFVVSNMNGQYRDIKNRFAFESFAHLTGSIYGYHCMLIQEEQDIPFLEDEKDMNVIVHNKMAKYNRFGYRQMAQALMTGYAPTFIGTTSNGAIVSSNFARDYMYTNEPMSDYPDPTKGKSVVEGIFTYVQARELLPEEHLNSYYTHCVEPMVMRKHRLKASTLDQYLIERNNDLSALPEWTRQAKAIMTADEAEESTIHHIAQLCAFFNIGLKPTMTLRTFGYNNNNNMQNNLRLCKDAIELTHLSFGIAHVAVTPLNLSGYTSKGMVTFNVDLRPSNVKNDEYISILNRSLDRNPSHFKLMLNNRQNLTFQGYADFFNAEGVGMTGITKREAIKLGSMWSRQYHKCNAVMPIQTFTFPELMAEVNGSAVQDDIIIPMLQAIKSEIEYATFVTNKTIDDPSTSLDTNVFYTTTSCNDHYACISLSAIQLRIRKMTGFAPALNIIKKNLNKWGLTSTSVMRHHKNKRRAKIELTVNPYLLEEAPHQKDRGAVCSRYIQNLTVLGKTYPMCPEYCNFIHDMGDLAKPFAVHGTFYKLMSLDASSSPVINHASVITASTNVSASELVNATKSKAKNVDSTVAIHIERLMGLFASGHSPLAYLEAKGTPNDVYLYSDGLEVTEEIAIREYEKSMSNFTRIFDFMDNEPDLKVFSLPNYRNWLVETHGMRYEDIERKHLLFNDPSYVNQFLHNLASVVCVHNEGSILSMAVGKPTPKIEQSSRILAVLELCKKMDTARKYKSGLITSRQNKITINTHALYKLINAKSDTHLAQILKGLNMNTKVFGIGVVESQISYLISLGVNAVELEQFFAFVENVKGTTKTTILTNKGVSTTNTITFDYMKVYNTITKTLAGAIAVTHGISLKHGKIVVRESHSMFRMRINDFMRTVGLAKITDALRRDKADGNNPSIVTLEDTIQDLAHYHEQGAIDLTKAISDDYVVCPVNVEGETQFLISTKDNMMAQTQDNTAITAIEMAREYFNKSQQEDAIKIKNMIEKFQKHTHVANTIGRIGKDLPEPVLTDPSGLAEPPAEPPAETA